MYNFHISDGYSCQSDVSGGICLMVLTLWEHIGGMYLEFSYMVYSHCENAR